MFIAVVIMTIASGLGLIYLYAGLVGVLTTIFVLGLISVIAAITYGYYLEKDKENGGRR
jgi:hypothetical protein|nr:MAG TPA: hypothetical protein [Caudoviricetes sp.]